MPAFFAALTAKVLEWLTGLIASAISKWNAMRKATEKIEADSQKILDQTEKAQTKEERDNAAKEDIRSF